MVTSEYARNVLPLLNNEGILSSILNSILSRDDEPVTDEALHSILSIKFMYDLCNQKLHITSGLRDLYLRLMFTSNSGEGTCAAHENSAAVRETQGSTKDAHGESHKPASGSKESHAGLEGSIQVEGTILRDLATNHDNYIAANPVAANQQRLPNTLTLELETLSLELETLTLELETLTLELETLTLELETLSLERAILAQRVTGKGIEVVRKKTEIAKKENKRQHPSGKSVGSRLLECMKETTIFG
ncbi:hypothetical protein GNI_078990 [Gregarina niphandrodes]|uniref:Uncharacterized protein n=1 Tax=Gregarina niphandrodes TaxID=110365 RepID=A0A023B6J1_GRENI|nr:hypothetical protein GNI_078990 [Gregarina niphandrodes]EZG66580.1 hypothetical protein GNI_078990 [Gregarina niphandrodes]|eukprot:XP_011130589.1 hypothetical protein GNI_078990 [Gregarina niphandrodes]